MIFHQGPRHLRKARRIGDNKDMKFEFADCVLDVAMRHAHAAMRDRFGELRDADGAPVPLVTLGMGKRRLFPINVFERVALKMRRPPVEVRDATSLWRGF